jgi:tetratricopeptide (TPR) repeat protein
LAAIALGKFKDPISIGPLIQACKDSDEDVRVFSVSALGNFRDSRVVAPLISAALNDVSPYVRRDAAYGLGELKDRRGVQPLVALLEDKEWIAQKSALEALGEIGDPTSLPALERLVNDNTQHEESDYFTKEITTITTSVVAKSAIDKIKATDAYVQYTRTQIQNNRSPEKSQQITPSKAPTLKENEQTTVAVRSTITEGDSIVIKAEGTVDGVSIERKDVQQTREEAMMSTKGQANLRDAKSIVQPSAMSSTTINKLNQTMQDYSVMTLDQALSQLPTGQQTFALNLREQGRKAMAEVPDSVSAKDLFCIGQGFANAGDYDAAIDSYISSIRHVTADPESKALAQSGMAHAYMILGDYSQSEVWYTKAISTAKESNNRSLISIFCLDLIELYICSNNFESAKMSLEAARNQMPENELSQWILYDVQRAKIETMATNDSKASAILEGALRKAIDQHEEDWEASVRKMLAVTKLLLGDYASAVEHSEKALKHCQEKGQLGAQAEVLGTLGKVYKQMGNYQKAQYCYEESRKIYKSIGDEMSLAVIDYQLAVLIGDTMEQAEPALEILDEYIRIAKLKKSANLDIEKAMLLQHILLGENHLKKGNLESAYGEFKKALALSVKSDRIQEQLRSEYSMGQCSADLGRSDMAERHFLNVLDMSNNINMPESQITAHNGLAELYFSIGRTDEGLVHLDNAIEIIMNIMTEIPFYQEMLPSALLVAGNVYYQNSDFDSAKCKYEQAVHHSMKTNRSDIQGAAHCTLSQVYARMGRYSESKELAKKGLQMIHSSGNSDLYTHWLSILEEGHVI